MGPHSPHRGCLGGLQCPRKLPIALCLQSRQKVAHQVTPASGRSPCFFGHVSATAGGRNSSRRSGQRCRLALHAYRELGTRHCTPARTGRKLPTFRSSSCCVGRRPTGIRSPIYRAAVEFASDMTAAQTASISQAYSRFHHFSATDRALSTGALCSRPIVGMRQQLLVASIKMTGRHLREEMVNQVEAVVSREKDHA